jgi:hypothetical protein
MTVSAERFFYGPVAMLYPLALFTALPTMATVYEYRLSYPKRLGS